MANIEAFHFPITVICFKEHSWAKGDNDLVVVGHVIELVDGATGMIELNADAAQLGATVHPHPTLSEVLMEAAHVLCGHAIHI